MGAVRLQGGSSAAGSTGHHGLAAYRQAMVLPLKGKCLRNMSFFLTTRQFLDGTKDVTRRLGWSFLKKGDRVMAVEKGQGLKKGEKINRLGEIEIVSRRRVKLNSITQRDVIREGFPNLSRLDFIFMFCRKMKIYPWHYVNRIQFKRVD